MNKKIIFAITAGIVIAGFFGILIYAEMFTDENRILVEKLASLNQTILEQSFEYPPDAPNVDVQFVEILPGAESGWHTHNVPLVVTILHGDLTVYYCYEDDDNSIDIKQCQNKGTARNYHAGDSFVEAIDVEHNGVNEGFVPVKVHVVALNPIENWDDVYSQSTNNDLVVDESET